MNIVSAAAVVKNNAIIHLWPLTGYASQAMVDAYKRCRDYLDAAIELVRPGRTTAEIASVWPKAEEFGFPNEEACFALQYGHGVGLAICLAAVLGAAWLAREAGLGRDPLDGTKPYSPGYSQRLSALGAAELGNVMVETGDTQTAMLELDQEALNAKRRNRLLAHESAALVYWDMTRRAQVQEPPSPPLGDHP